MSDDNKPETQIPTDPVARARFLAEIEERERMRESLIDRIPQLMKRYNDARKAGNEEEAEELRQMIDSIHKKTGARTT